MKVLGSSRAVTNWPLTEVTLDDCHYRVYPSYPLGYDTMGSECIAHRLDSRLVWPHEA
jgi:hypothetical protein